MSWGGDGETGNSGLRLDEHDRGAAELVGVVLLIGFVLVAATSVVLVGSSVLAELEGSSHDETTTQSFQEAKVELASLQTNDSADLSLSETAPENTRVDPAAGNVTITTADGNEYRTTLGTITYEREDKHLAYQGGGVWELHDDSATMISRPEFRIVNESGAATIHFTTISLQGDRQRGGDLVVRSNGVNESFEEIPRQLPPGTTTIEIESKYYQAWGELLEDRASVDYDHDDETVTGTIYIPEDVAVQNSVTVDGRLAMSGGIGVTSFDSRMGSTGSIGDGNYPETGDGDVFVGEDFSGGGSANVDGDLYADGDFTIDGSSEIDGNVTANGTVTIRTDEVTGRVVAAEDVLVDRGGVTFTETSEVVAPGDLVDTGSGNTYAGDVHVGGDISADGGGTTLTNTGEMQAGGTVSVSNSNGDVIQGAAAPSVSDDLEEIEEAGENIPSPSTEYDEALDRYKDEADNDDPGSLGGNNADDVVTTGDYYYDGDLSYGGNPSLTFNATDGDVNFVLDGDLYFGGNPALTFNTTDGDINLVVTGAVDTGSIDAHIIGDGRVNVYVRDNFETGGGASWTNDDGAGDRLWVYTAGDTAQTDIRGEFYGVVLSESEVTLGGGTDVYGAILTEGGRINGGQHIYYDEAIEDVEFGDGDSDGTYSTGYIDVSATEISIE